VTTVLDAKPDSPVAVLADGSTPLTAFVPTDVAFRRLVGQVTGQQPETEKRTFAQVANAFDVDTIEAVLLYHVVPGATVTYRQAGQADGAKLATALDGGTLRVRVHDRVILRDADTDDRNARVVEDRKNINQGNKQIAHGIGQVLRPVDLP